MEVSNKAPVGGMVSVVNGQFYEGGEFMPLHGLFCGKKGVARRAKFEKFAKVGKSIDLGGSKMFELSVYEGSGVWLILGYAIANTSAEAVAAFTAKTKVYAKPV